MAKIIYIPVGTNTFGLCFMGASNLRVILLACIKLYRVFPVHQTMRHSPDQNSLLLLHVRSICSSLRRSSRLNSISALWSGKRLLIRPFKFVTETWICFTRGGTRGEQVLDRNQVVAHYLLWCRKCSCGLTVLRKLDFVSAD